MGPTKVHSQLDGCCKVQRQRQPAARRGSWCALQNPAETLISHSRFQNKTELRITTWRSPPTLQRGRRFEQRLVSFSCGNNVNFVVNSAAIIGHWSIQPQHPWLVLQLPGGARSGQSVSCVVLTDARMDRYCGIDRFVC